MKFTTEVVKGGARLHVHLTGFAVDVENLCHVVESQHDPIGHCSRSKGMACANDLHSLARLMCLANDACNLIG